MPPDAPGQVFRNPAFHGERFDHEAKIKESHMSVTTEESAGGTAIRPFTIDFPEAEVEALRARIAATRWPERETVADESEGVPLATIQELAGYWATDHDWRKCEAKLNALPQFLTEIDGIDIHFIHVRSDHENALPLIVNHGWPGSIIEQLKIIDPLTDPTALTGHRRPARTTVAPPPVHATTPAGPPGRDIEPQGEHDHDSTVAHARRAAHGLAPAARRR
jgi:hypothetical protein